MPYFLDSNVIIGYIFDNGDSQGKYAKIIMRAVEEKHSGQTVKCECFGLRENGRCQTVKREISREFRKVIAALKRGLQPDEIVKQMERKNCRTYILIKDLAQKYNDDTISLAEVLRNSQWDFEAECAQRQEDITKTIRFHERIMPYRDIYDILCKSIDDIDDVKVILDAHDVGLKIHNLVLISGNYWDITAFSKPIQRVTSISEVRALQSFTS